jgi:tetratricopeptide (TPR) repeat protein
VWWGRCYEEQGTPPYWPWVQAVRSYVREEDQEGLLAEMGAEASNIAEILPEVEVKEKLPDLPPPTGLDTPEYARFRLFDSIATFLKVVSRIQPLVLVLDDLHWADKPSLLLFQFMATEIANSRLMLLGTYRDVELSRQHLLSETLAQLSREPVFRRIVLRGLSQDDTHRFVELTAGISPTSRLAQAIHSHTEGNPFFMGEVVRLLQERGELSDKYASLPQGMRIPEGVREVIGQRLNRLSQQCNEALTLASVIGREFSFDQLRSLVDDLTEDRLLGVVEEALAGRVIEELPQAVGNYQFAHPLIQETLLEELSLTRRVRLHARIAEVLEKLYGNQAEAHAAELAHHFGQAEAMLGSEKVVKYSLLAGEKALGSYAWEEALAHFQRGLTAKGIPSGWGGSGWYGRTDPATPGGGGHHKPSLKVGDVARAVAIAQYPLPSSTGVWRTASTPYIPRALRLTRPDSPTEARLLSSYGLELGHVENDYEGAQEAFARALAIARREQDIALELSILCASANVNLLHFRPREALDQARQAEGLARRLDDLGAAWLAHLDLARLLPRIGEVEEAQQHVSAILVIADKLRDRYRLAVAFSTNARLYRQLGRWAQARDFSDRGLAVEPQDYSFLWDRATLEFELGEFDLGEVYLDQLLRTASPRERVSGALLAYRALSIPLIARITGVLDRLDVSAEAAETLVSSPLTNPLFSQAGRAALGLMAVLRGDGARCAEHYSSLDRVRGVAVLLFYISGDRLLGLLSHTMGNLDQASQHFEDSLGFCRKAGYRPELAWTCCDYADTLR